jgi:hypothetical protein
VVASSEQLGIARRPRYPARNRIRPRPVATISGPEVATCAEPGALDGGTHIRFAVR